MIAGAAALTAFLSAGASSGAVAPGGRLATGMIASSLARATGCGLRKV